MDRPTPVLLMVRSLGLGGTERQLTETARFLDRNRFEQELIFYIDKLDITEEKIRLKSHCDYFIEALKGTDANGKKLGFISQEIGREINTKFLPKIGAQGSPNTCFNLLRKTPILQYFVYIDLI